MAKPSSCSRGRGGLATGTVFFFLVLVLLAGIVLDPDEGGIWSPEETPTPGELLRGLKP